MAPARGRFCPPLLLLLLGLWVAEDPVSTRPGNMTPAQWFDTQHVQPSPQGCNTAMRKINKFSKRCKDFNTFLHESFSSVTTSCQTPNTACRNGRNNFHQSQTPESLTECKLSSERYPECKYNKEERNASYTVACEPPEKKDSKKFKWVRVHLDKLCCCY